MCKFGDKTKSITTKMIKKPNKIVYYVKLNCCVNFSITVTVKARTKPEKYYCEAIDNSHSQRATNSFVRVYAQFATTSVLR